MRKSPFKAPGSLSLTSIRAGSDNELGLGGPSLEWLKRNC